MIYGWNLYETNSGVPQATQLKPHRMFVYFTVYFIVYFMCVHTLTSASAAEYRPHLRAGPLQYVGSEGEVP